MGSTKDAIKIARSYLGVREHNGDNRTIIGQKFGWNGVAWCAEFTSVVCKEAGLVPNQDFPWTASVPAAKDWFQSKGRWYHTPQVGDWVCYSNYGRNGSPYHVEIVIKVTDSTITTIGGNTSGHTEHGVEGNGDGCYEKTLSRGLSRISGYGRPVYGSASPTTGDEDTPMYVSVDKTDKSRKEELTSGEWHQIAFNVNNSKGAEKFHSKGDYPTFLYGKCYYDGVVYLAIEGMPKGTEGQVRLVYGDTGSDKVTAHCPMSEFVASDGVTYVAHPVAGYVPGKTKAHLEVVHFGAANVKPHVVGGQVRVMVWEV